MASRQALWQAERKRRGLCIRCGKPKPRDIGSLCLECAIKRRESVRKRLGSKTRNTKAKTYKLAARPPRKPRKPPQTGAPAKKTAWRRRGRRLAPARDFKRAQHPCAARRWIRACPQGYGTFASRS